MFNDYSNFCLVSSERESVNIHVLAYHKVVEIW